MSTQAWTFVFIGSTIALYLAIGIMIPIRLGSVSILQLIVDLHLINTLTALILVYTAQSLPLAIFILHEFMQQIPKDLKEAARCDGVSEYVIFLKIILPLTRPAIATVGVFTMVPVWNDLVPASDFVTTLFDTPLPDGLPHFLIFGFRQDSFLSTGSSDGVIQLSSQLRDAAQEQATSIRGFDEGHVSILNSDAAIEHLNTILREAAQ